MVDQNLSQQKERIFFIDVLRGISIFGIFLVNMLFFHLPNQYTDPLLNAKTDLDRTIYIFIDIFAQASFYPLFAFLFGYGLMMIKERVEFRGVSSQHVLLRRLLFLLAIGIIHAFLIWTGDILITYALFGFVLLLFIRFSSKTLIKSAFWLYFIPNFLISLLLYLIPQEFLQLDETEKAEKAFHTYQQGNFIEITKFRIQEWFEINNSFTLFMMLFLIYPLIQMGAGFAKEHKLENNKENFQYYKKLLVFTLPIALIIKSLPYWRASTYADQYVQDFIGGPLLATSYLSALFMVVNSGYMQKIARFFAAVGKMSLSNYLFQSLICTTLFYGYGFGLYGKMTYTNSTLLVIVIFVVQVFFSHFWLEKYSYGPMEWVWRKFTYRKIIEVKMEK